MKIIDISLPLSTKTIAHPKEPRFLVTPQRNLESDGVSTSKITTASHFGTHIDAPVHFIKDGSGIDNIDLEKLIGTCQVLEVSPEENLITQADIEGKTTSERVLFKSSNSLLLTQPYTKEYISLSMGAAEYLVKSGVKLVGTDYIAIEASGSPGHPVHTKLLESKIVIVEGLNLANVEAGSYKLIVLPIKLKGLDGSPARAVLIEE
ncbi:cyclase family protein [Patescibacteria group bacterium]|nr:cyclase family protein [Patescibacteria group bacterium]